MATIKYLQPLLTIVAYLRWTPLGEAYMDSLLSLFLITSEWDVIRISLNMREGKHVISREMDKEKFSL